MPNSKIQFTTQLSQKFNLFRNKFKLRIQFQKNEKEEIQMIAGPQQFQHQVVPPPIDSKNRAEKELIDLTESDPIE